MLDVPPAVLRTLTEYEEHRLRENLRRGHHVAFVDATFEVDAFEAGLSTLSEALRSHGELISTLPSPGDGGESQIRFSLLTASPLTADELAGRIEAPHTGVRSAMRAAAPRQAPSGPPTPVEGADDLASLQSISETVRETVERINSALQEQSAACASAVDFLGTVGARTRSNEESARRMGEATKQMLRQAESLRREVRKFRI